MEAAKKMMEKLTGGKKLQKDQWLIIILVGILLCVIAVPAEKKDSKSGLSNIIDDTIDDHKVQTGQEDTSGYAGYWEEKLEEALRCVEVVGKVRVLITLQRSEQKIVEKDGPEQNTDTEETDSAGGRRTVRESSVEKSTIYTADGQGRDVPYVVMTIEPVVEGVVVIAQGADRGNVRENIIEAIQVLFDIDPNKIKIVKMKNNQ